MSFLFFIMVSIVLYHNSGIKTRKTVCLGNVVRIWSESDQNLLRFMGTSRFDINELISVPQNSPFGPSMVTIKFKG